MLVEALSLSVGFGNGQQALSFLGLHPFPAGNSRTKRIFDTVSGIGRATRLRVPLDGDRVRESATAAPPYPASGSRNGHPAQCGLPSKR